MTANDSQTSGRKPVPTDVTALQRAASVVGQVSYAFTSQNAYRVGCGRRISHQWTSLIRLAYSLAPKGNRNLPQRRNYERTGPAAPKPSKQQTGKCPAHGILTGHFRKSQFVIAAASTDRPTTDAT